MVRSGSEDVVRVSREEEEKDGTWKMYYVQKLLTPSAKTKPIVTRKMHRRRM